MRLRADLIAAGLLLAAQPAFAQRTRPAPTPPATAAEPDLQEPAGEGPRGSSRTAPGAQRYDEVGYAAIGDAAGVAAVSGALSGGYAEVTSLASGRTVVVSVVPGATPGRIVILSPTAAAEIGVSADPAAVRVRRVTPAPQDVALLDQGQLAGKRSDAPAALLVPLRKRLGMPPLPRAAASPPPPRPIAREPAPAPITAAAPPPPPRTAAPLVTDPSVPPPSADLVLPDSKPKAPKPAQPAPPPAAAPKTVARDTPTGFYVQVAALADRVRAKTLADRIGGVIETAGSLYQVQLGPFPDGYAAERGRAAAVREGYPDARIIRVD